MEKVEAGQTDVGPVVGVPGEGTLSAAKKPPAAVEGNVAGIRSCTTRCSSSSFDVNCRMEASEAGIFMASSLGTKCRPDRAHGIQVLRARNHAQEVAALWLTRYHGRVGGAKGRQT